VAFRVLLDACVLVPYELSNVILTLAEQGLFTPLWSQQILDETERALTTKLGIALDKARKRIAAMTTTFPDAMVDNYADLIKVMRCHKKDRHVLAAAVRGNAQTLVTANLDDFPGEAADPYDVEIVHPDRFLSDQLDLDPDLTIHGLDSVAAGYNSPSMTVLELMRRLRSTTPNFAQYVGTKIMLDEPIDDSAAALVQASSDDVFRLFAPSGELDPTTPEGVGYAWLYAAHHLPEERELFDALCLKPADWKDHQELASMLDEFGIASRVDPAIEAPDRMAFMRLIAGLDSPVQVFVGGTLAMTSMLVITLVRHEELWRVFSLGQDFPPAGRVLDNWSYRASARREQVP
jgi:predicted nucleic acid-binding protein